MKKLKQTLFVLCVLSLLSGCAKNETVPNTCDGLLEEAQLFSQQANTFAYNPSRSGCNTLKSTAFRLLEMANKCSEYQYNTEFKYAFQVWQDIDCSEF